MQGNVVGTESVAYLSKELSHLVGGHRNVQLG
jgi:hypothetical protein